MTETILSVGIDLGTTTTQMVVSRLHVENTASAFTIPRMQITGREICYRSAVYETPLESAEVIDAAAVEQIIRREYQKAGILPEQVQTGAVIITGETARKENAQQVLSALSGLAGKFVVATAGPALESALAARGAGADVLARERGQYVLHFDIGGGTSNMALFDPEGNLEDTGCVNVGGRLIKLDSSGTVTYVSQVLECLDVPHLGQMVTPEQLQPIIRTLVAVLEQAAGLQTKNELLSRFITDRTVQLPNAPVLFSFSGGVADLIDRSEKGWLEYGDLGVLLGRGIRQSLLCSGSYSLGQETLRATVIGAGSYSTELSGSTVCVTETAFPMQDLPALRLTEEEETAAPAELAAAIERKVKLYLTPAALSLRGSSAPSYDEIQRLAEGIAQSAAKLGKPLVVVLEQDMAKALGHALRLRLGHDTGIVCLDGLYVPEGSYLDLAAPIAGGAVVPVVVKTLAFS